MNHMADGAQAPAAPEQTLRAQAPPARERSAGELVKLMSEQVSVLVRDELKLAQIEMVRKGKQAVAGIAALTGKGRLQKAAPPVPEEAVSSAKTDVEEIKERVRR
jgi:hypothetical protein